MSRDAKNGSKPKSTGSSYEEKKAATATEQHIREHNFQAVRHQQQQEAKNATTRSRYSTTTQEEITTYITHKNTTIAEIQADSKKAKKDSGKVLYKRKGFKQATASLMHDCILEGWPIEYISQTPFPAMAMARFRHFYQLLYKHDVDTLTMSDEALAKQVVKAIEDTSYGVDSKLNKIFKKAQKESRAFDIKFPDLSRTNRRLLQIIPAVIYVDDSQGTLNIEIAEPDLVQLDMDNSLQVAGYQEGEYTLKAPATYVLLDGGVKAIGRHLVAMNPTTGQWELCYVQTQLGRYSDEQKRIERDENTRNSLYEISSSLHTDISLTDEILKIILLQGIPAKLISFLYLAGYPQNELLVDSSIPDIFSIPLFDGGRRAIQHGLICESPVVDSDVKISPREKSFTFTPKKLVLPNDPLRADAKQSEVGSNASHSLHASDSKHSIPPTAAAAQQRLISPSSGQPPVSTSASSSSSSSSRASTMNSSSSSAASSSSFSFSSSSSSSSSSGDISV